MSILLFVIMLVFVMIISFMSLAQKEVSSQKDALFVDSNSIDYLVCNVLTVYSINLLTGVCMILPLFVM